MLHNLSLNLSTTITFSYLWYQLQYVHILWRMTKLASILPWKWFEFTDHHRYHNLLSTRLLNLLMNFSDKLMMPRTIILSFRATVETCNTNGIYAGRGLRQRWLFHSRSLARTDIYKGSWYCCHLVCDWNTLPDSHFLGWRRQGLRFFSFVKAMDWSNWTQVLLHDCPLDVNSTGKRFWEKQI